MHGMGWGGGMWFDGIFWLIIFGLVIRGIVTVINNNRSRTYHRTLPPAEDALEILKRRNARGEITREQFEQMKQDILRS